MNKGKGSQLAAEGQTPTDSKTKNKAKTGVQKVKTVPILAGHEDDEKQARELVGGIDAAESEITEMQNKLEAKRHSSFEKALLAGEILCRLKHALKQAPGQGNWQAYVQNRIGCSPKKASMYMRFHTHRDELEKSEIFPKLGIAEADKLLQKHKKPVTTDPAGGHKGSEPETEGPAATASDPQVEETLELADGRSLPLAEIGWSEGLITKADLERLIHRASTRSTSGTKRKAAAREQQIIATIAADVNRTCRDDDRGEAKTAVCAALEKVRAFIEELDGSKAKQAA